MSVREKMEDKLNGALSPEELTITDESHLHAGHGGAHPEGESHFRIHIVSVTFEGKSRVERHRMINEILAEELKARVHALAVRAYAPGEGRQ
ncbi:BolA family protein [Afifella marina]|uniref:Transcriptional regulator, BolA protein family n=1 Tax=Afifella marina DSM 2698 TaxID=1120955 RepID=A0A1G5NX53_AFIMA|nr:BolA family protein [Afifella marina]MBK1624468.1 BolA family transcriptional regulator [Afifella marina DSM 2698]MBK1628200.1 BolA family transcriptional regulator [Afifella marina]MBK5916634.1 BolA family transcriptional regulator [Afifella marina]RAI18988.1 BolA family transcriptional regulator [Afifella marina DSM 2698]SCZ41913.1 transcriptional regulator, BolA protein family [Afifella marina DSM 2698]